MISSAPATELLRDALAQLYDPHALAASPLTSELMRRGLLQTPSGLFDRLIATIERMKPPASAPAQAHGWCNYHYLYRRYVDCQSHALIAEEMGKSVRQAFRIHQVALEVAADLLFRGDSSLVSAGLGNSVPVRNTADSLHSTRSLGIGPNMSLRSELSLINDQPPVEPIVVADVVSSVFETLGRIAKVRRVSLSAQIGESIPPVRLSRVALRQMVLNSALYLMERFPEDGHSTQESTLSVSVRASPQGDTITLELERKRSAQSEEAAHQATLDTLLVAVKQLAQQQRCTVVEGPTSTDRTTLTLVLRTGEGARNILVLDDNPDVGELVQRILTGSQYEVLHVRLASQGIKLAREVQPWAILLDVVLPIQDGWEVLSVLRADSITSHIPVVVCSVLPDRELALSLGAADFLAKPITRGALIQALTRIEPSNRLAGRSCQL
jgi:CheY-like chemotaxis protein